MIGPADAWAVVPVKRFAAAKRRLTPALGAGERAHLARVMFEDVLDALSRSRAHLAGVVVVTADEEAARLAARHNAVVVSDGGCDEINAAIRLGLDCVVERGGAAVLVIPSDIPQLSPRAIADAVKAVEAAGSLAVVRATRDGGTNLLACRPVGMIPLCFGPHSFERHCRFARAHKMSLCTSAADDLGLDIDRPDDLAAFLALRRPTRTLSYLTSLPAMEPELSGLPPLLHDFPDGRNLTRDEAFALAALTDLEPLLAAARKRRDRAHGAIVSYSRKVFIPLTKLCRDVCHYCTFAHPPRAGEAAFMSADEVLAVARAGRNAGCKEALFTLGDKPERRYRAARDELARLGHSTTLSYLAAMARLVFEETGLLPHVNPGLLDASDLAALRKVSISQGIMLECASVRLMQKGGPHHGSPDKAPAARLATIRMAGEQRVPLTTGILIGIGETRRERIESLFALRDLHETYGHIQEIIVQNFRPKPGTRMADAPAPSEDEHLWTIAMARLIFPPSMNIQAPPNLSVGALPRLIEAGINDWGGVSPVTPDHVNPEAPWPHLQVLERATASAGKRLHERLAIYPAYASDHRTWVDQRLHTALLHGIDADGWPRLDEWSPGTAQPLPVEQRLLPAPRMVLGDLSRIIDRAVAGRMLPEHEIVRLFRARGEEFAALCTAADALRRDVCGDTVSYVVTRNINYTNICSFKCQFCAFSKGKTSENLRGRPYNLELGEIAARAREAWQRGATEVCMQGGIHPDFTGRTYVAICRAVREAVPDMHVHAFSPLEVHQGAATLDLPVEQFLLELREAGLGTLPGTAAEVLDDEVRAVLCPDKIGTDRWLEVMRAAHRTGFKTTATIMYGHVDHYRHWARHLLRLRALQAETGGFTEFVPLPFVHMEAPIYLKGRARRGPTFREAVLMHAVARLVFHPLLSNIQTSWVKMGPEGVKVCLRSGANDLGGTLMDETITRSAGAMHGQEMTPEEMERTIRSLGRTPRQRNTVYGDVSAERYQASFLPRCALASDTLPNRAVQ
jgi:FO synthase